MRDAVEEYLDRVMAQASLPRRDHARVRGELKDHLSELAGQSLGASPNQEELFAMLEREFGNPEVVGTGISTARGPVRTYLERLRKRLPVAVAAGVVLAFSIRWAVAEPFYVPGKGAEPLVPQFSRVLVYKLGSTFHPGDVLVFRDPQGIALLAIVKADQGGTLTVSRNGQPDRQIPRSWVVGRVVANTR